MIPLGSKVRDQVSGFTGIAVGRAEYLYSTPTVQVAPDVLAPTGSRQSSEWIEEAQLRVVGTGRVVGYRPPDKEGPAR